MDFLISTINTIQQTASTGAIQFMPLLKDSFFIGGQYMFTGDDVMSVTAFINALFKMAIILGAIIAVFEFVYGGVMYIISAAGGPKSNAKKRILNSTIGLLMLLSTYITFSTINEDMVDLDITKNYTPIQQKPSAGNPSSVGANVDQSYRGN